MNEFIELLRPLMMSVALCTTRFYVAFTVAPVLNPQIVQGLIRNAVVLSFSMIIFPIVFPFVVADKMTGLTFAVLIIKEGALGLFIGFLSGLFFWAIEGVGNYIDYQRGASMASLVDPASGNQNSLTGTFLMQLIVLLFYCGGGLLVFLGGIYESYKFWPVLSFFPKLDTDIALFFLEKTDGMFEIMILLASPLVIILFLTDFGLGLINRFSPQLNVYFLSMPVKCAVAALVLILYLQFLLMYVKDNFLDHLDVFRILKHVIH